MTTPTDGRHAERTRSIIRVGVTDGKPQIVDGRLVTVRRKRGHKYTIIFEKLPTDNPPRAGADQTPAHK